MSDGGKIFKPHLRRAAVFATPMPGALLHRRRGQRTLARFGLPDMILRFILTAALLLVASAGGYWARRRNLADERLAEKLMTFVVAVGYSVIGFLSVWSIRLHASDLWLPVLGGAHVMLMIAVGFAAARFVTVDRSERALLGLSSGIGNTGITMGGFVLYLLFGVEGLGLSGIYGLMWYPMIVLAAYPIARHWSENPVGGSLGRLLLRSILDWRSIGLPMTIVAIFLSVAEVPYPRAVDDWHLVDVLMFLVIALAYFSIGLRLHFSFLAALRRQIVVHALLRFAVAAGLAVLLAWLTRLTPWPLEGLSRNVLVLESFMPAAVTVVAIANMFSLKPREASVLFVTNTLIYLAVVLPLVLWIYSRP